MTSHKLTTIIRPRFLALDSSHLARIADDKFSQNPKRRERVSAFETSCNEHGWILVLCWHHFDELLKHRDSAVVANRIQFFRSLPIVAWVASIAGEEVPGSIVDILVFEMSAAFDLPSSSANNVRDRVSERLFRIGSGREAIKVLAEAGEQLQNALWVREERAREIVAIDTSNFTDIGHMKVARWLGSELRSAEDAEQQFQVIYERLSTHIQQQGDKRIPDAATVAARFISEVKVEASGVPRTAKYPVVHLLSKLEIAPTEIGPETTFADVFELVGFRRKMQGINELLGLNWSALKSRVSQHHIPSEVIQVSLRNHCPPIPERKGSELNDRYLACLAAYADCTYVDKRTLENFRRARQKCPELSALVRNVEKASGYSEITKRLAN